jgi:hypothetical protein
MRLLPASREILRLLRICPWVPVDVVAALAGARARVSTYQALARLRGAGLVQYRQVNLRLAACGRPLRLWATTARGREALHACASLSGLDESDASDRLAVDPAGRCPTGGVTGALGFAAARGLAAFFVAQARAGRPLQLCAWASPWIYSSDGPVVRLPAAADVRSTAGSETCLERLILLPDFGTAPIVRFREMLRRVIKLECVEATGARRAPRLVIVTTSVGNRSSRETAWEQLVQRICRKEDCRELPTTVLDWHQVAGLLGGVAARSNADRGSMRRVMMPREDELLNLVGRHPLLTDRQLTLLLAVAPRRELKLRKDLMTRGLVRMHALVEPCGAISKTAGDDVHRLSVAELTGSGRRRLASSLGLPVAIARRHHGLFGGTVTQRRRVTRAVAHTVGANEMFVAIAVRARIATARGADEALEEWRSAAACERQHCKPDGYGCFRRGSVRYGFLLEYDRGTERDAQYRAKLMAYLAYLRSGQAARDFQGFPTILFVTTSPAAEERIICAAGRIWARMGYPVLPILTTTTVRIHADERGILGPIWRRAGDSDHRQSERWYWLPEECGANNVAEPNRA